MKYTGPYSHRDHLLANCLGGLAIPVKEEGLAWGGALDPESLAAVVVRFVALHAGQRLLGVGAHAGLNLAPAGLPYSLPDARVHGHKDQGEDEEDKVHLRKIAENKHILFGSIRQNYE